MYVIVIFYSHDLTHNTRSRDTYDIKFNVPTRQLQDALQLQPSLIISVFVNEQQLTDYNNLKILFFVLSFEGGTFITVRFFAECHIINSFYA